MIVELRGVGFVNKGAELMLYSMVEILKTYDQETIFVMEVNSTSPLRKIWSMGIKAKTNLKFKNINLNRFFKLLPNGLKHNLGWVSEEEVQVVLDASGFAFGDKWGAAKAGTRLANHLAIWKSKGKKVILLPQAFGPFTKPDLIQKMKFILNQADLVYARDKVSFDFLNQLRIEKGTENIFLAPDFTNLTAPIFPENKQKYSDSLAIIPNQKMMDTSDESFNKSYPDFLKVMVELALQKGQKAFFLIHESEKDKAIAEMVNEKLDKPIPIIEEENPLLVKGIIGSCFAVITSRFHGLVSALSQSVPCLATGWSHKYEMLFEDYKFSEGLCQLQRDKAYYEEKINLIIEIDSRKKISQLLTIESAKQKKLSDQMWQRVFQKMKK
ncbi:polysaccharide pyruvyl transferase family protein [Negadavirga shengliensis]|uniref:Polysaccharide pyruvyl transferase family protein n=1 Tax=Negadavirga shengliensis TaxID=1389218 RepID=A0ABV9T2Z4_9BACT